LRYRPDGTLVLRFDRDEVMAEGKNLHRLRDAIPADAVHVLDGRALTAMGGVI
jgi:hypothetical protein